MRISLKAHKGWSRKKGKDGTGKGGKGKDNTVTSGAILLAGSAGTAAATIPGHAAGPATDGAAFQFLIQFDNATIRAAGIGPVTFPCSTGRPANGLTQPGICGDVSWLSEL